MSKIETQYMSKEVPLAIYHVFAGIAVTDYESALAWYERLMGRPPDLKPQENEAAWQLTDTGWFYIVRDTNRAGKALVTIMVNDLEELVASLREEGLETPAIKTVPGLYRKVVITDPEGNMISFGEDRSMDG